jgi:hypothetical protein
VIQAGSTTTKLVFSPAMRYSTTDARQNCSGTPIDGADITFVGSASTNYVQPLMYHKDAFQFVTGDLPMMDDAQKCVIKRMDGLSIRVWQGSDIRNDELLMRLDILYGTKTLDPRLGARMSGTN